MKTFSISETISELRFLLAENDISRASRKMLDVTKEFDLPGEVELLAHEVRIAHNNLQNESQVVDPAIIEKCRFFVSYIEQHKEYYEDFISKIDHGTLPVYSGIGISKRFWSGNSPFYLQPSDINLYTGQITGVVGENGNGKTTLLRIIAGELLSDTGDISYPILGLKAGQWYKIKNQIAFIPQRIDKWHGTLLDNLSFYATMHGIKDAENNKQVTYILHRLGLDRFKHLKWSEISSGYRLRFELAKMLMWRPKLLVLDEPLANLDINAQQLFLQDLKFIIKSIRFPLSIILSSQALHEVESVADNIIFIKQGQTLYSGSQKEFGQERQYNTFEIAGSFSRESLTQVMQLIPGYKIEDSGTVFLISVPVDFTPEEFLQTLLINKIRLNYFRDISFSTRKLFKKDF
ncbi:MAG: ybhF [Bacteroidetes bacterium]|jgi:ABC-2 type transport system ATP-binding protein|nr:ybhF [Bacteroidota bacterium]